MGFKVLFLCVSVCFKSETREYDARFLKEAQLHFPHATIDGTFS